LGDGRQSWGVLVVVVGVNLGGRDRA
jgi:hypothetical protein